MTFFMSFWAMFVLASLILGGSAVITKRLYPKESITAYWVVYALVVVSLLPLLFRGQ